MRRKIFCSWWKTQQTIKGKYRAIFVQEKSFSLGITKKTSANSWFESAKANTLNNQKLFNNNKIQKNENNNNCTCKFGIII